MKSTVITTKKLETLGFKKKSSAIYFKTFQIKNQETKVVLTNLDKGWTGGISQNNLLSSQNTIDLGLITDLQDVINLNNLLTKQAAQ